MGARLGRIDALEWHPTRLQLALATNVPFVSVFALRNTQPVPANLASLAAAAEFMIPQNVL
jgi:hypothetical protein